MFISENLPNVHALRDFFLLAATDFSFNTKHTRILLNCIHHNPLKIDIFQFFKPI